MRVVFFGTPEVAVPILQAVLASSHEVTGVVTQPDRPRGRGRSVSPSPVKEVAIANGLPVLQPESPKEDGFADALAVLEPEALAVAAYGHILPPAVLAVAPALNAHFSLLPRYRGAAPVQRALMDGARETGVSVFLLEPALDTGPVVARERIEVGPEETAGEVFDRLVPIGARLLVEVLGALGRGAVEPQPQDDAAASPAPKIKPEEAVLDWSRPATALANLVRALNPRPGARTTAAGRRLTVRRARPVEGSGTPGEVLDANDDAFVVATGEGALALLEVQPEGKRPMSGPEFLRGYRLKAGAVLGKG